MVAPKLKLTPSAKGESPAPISAEVAEATDAVSSSVIEPVKKIMLQAPVPEMQVPTKPVELPSIKNPDTGSEFFVIGVGKDGLRLSLRFWKEPSETGFTTLSFRLRLGDLLPDYPELGVTVLQYVEAHYPAMVGALSASSKASSTHVSVESSLLIPADAWEHKQVVSLFAQSSFCHEFYTKLKEVFPDFSLVDETTLFGFMSQQVHRCVADVMTPGWAKVQKSVYWRVGLTKDPLMFKAPAQKAAAKEEMQLAEPKGGT
jgi:hypothetical protein